MISTRSEYQVTKFLALLIIRADLQRVSYLPTQLYMCFADHGLNKNNVPGFIWRGYSWNSILLSTHYVRTTVRPCIFPCRLYVTVPMFLVTRMIVIPATLLLVIMLSCELLRMCFCSPKVITDFPRTFRTKKERFRSGGGLKILADFIIVCQRCDSGWRKPYPRP